ncbi:MAG TPA: SPOR domain-containing protein [Terracidiphilus sp.]|jgi:cell division septation protein DedD|nr:SPOR domain-containing protein [Terracidiphilus sp.]
MPRSFGGSVFEPVEEGRDKEITLGPTMLALLGLALLALCSICFIGGYALGHSGQTQLATAATTGGPSAAQLFRDKPAAANSDQPAPAGQPASSGIAASTPAQAAPPESATPAGNAPSGAGNAPAIVHAALPAQAVSGQPASPAGAVQPAVQQAGSFMVQIAAVSHSEDADVLMSALRQRGYAISMRRDPVDNLIHVQVGPFATHNDALAMRQRLFNDGYNAVIQP